MPKEIEVTRLPTNTVLPALANPIRHVPSAATAAVISDTALADDAEITIDIDAVSGGGTEKAEAYDSPKSAPPGDFGL